MECNGIFYTFLIVSKVYLSLDFGFKDNHVLMIKKLVLLSFFPDIQSSLTLKQS
jgi:hypothetical protein